MFAYTTDAKNWPKWQSTIPEAEQTSPGPVGVGTSFKGTIRMMGLGMKWTARATEFDANRRFGKRIVCGSVANEQHNIYESRDGGTRFTIAYDMKVAGLMKLFSPMIASAMRDGLKKALGSLKNLLQG